MDGINNKEVFVAIICLAVFIVLLCINPLITLFVAWVAFELWGGLIH